uniref:Uncharacterized protein n=1 Tax=Rhizophora mucronata TaxID=61149 RepID=A0A2P2QQF5_RHIMU
MILHNALESIKKYNDKVFACGGMETQLLNKPQRMRRRQTILMFYFSLLTRQLGLYY